MNKMESSRSNCGQNTNKVTPFGAQLSQENPQLTATDNNNMGDIFSDYDAIEDNGKKPDEANAGHVDSHDDQHTADSCNQIAECQQQLDPDRAWRNTINMEHFTSQCYENTNWALHHRANCSDEHNDPSTFHEKSSPIVVLANDSANGTMGKRTSLQYEEKNGVKTCASCKRHCSFMGVHETHNSTTAGDYDPVDVQCSDTIPKILVQKQEFLSIASGNQSHTSSSSSSLRGSFDRGVCHHFLSTNNFVVANGSEQYSDSNGSVIYGQSTAKGLDSADPVYFLDARNFEKPVQRPGPRIHVSLVSSNGTLDEKSVRDLVDEIWQTKDEKKRSSICQIILVKRLPRLVQSGNMEDVAHMLTVHEGNLQVSASVTLLNMLLNLRHRKESSLTEELFSVLEVIQATLLDQNDDSPIIYTLASLHLMTSSALVTRCPKPEQDRFKSLLLSSKELKRYTKGGVKSVVLKVLQIFQEDYKDHLEESISFPVWVDMDWSKQSRQTRQETFQQATFCELVVFVFTFLSEISQQAWKPQGMTLITGLGDLHKAVPRKGKNKQNEEAIFLLQFLSLRGLVALLSSTFHKEKSNCDHASSVTDIAINLIQSQSKSKRNILLKEVSCLSSHGVKDVRQRFNLLLRSYEHWLSDLTLGHLEHCLQSVGLRRLSHSPEASPELKNEAIRDSCSWNKVSAFLCGKPVEGAIYVPKAACMANVPLLQCMDEHPGLREEDVFRSIQLSEEAEQHKNNFNNLRKLSPAAQHVIQLLALQYDPVTFYLTEVVEGHRLLMHLLECRYALAWLNTRTIIAAARQIARALVYLQGNDMVSREVTTYNMVIYDLEDQQRPGGNVFSEKFVIKLADLGLTHKYRENDKIRPVRDPGLIPIRWICSTALSTGEYTPASMVFSFGCCLYELATHGLQPYTSYDITETENFDTKRYLNPRLFKLNQWACIPDSVNTLIQTCTDPDPNCRPTLAQVEKRLKDLDMETFPDVTSVLDLDAALGWDKKYPEPCYDQVKRKHIPRKGIPPPVKQLIAAGTKSELYINTRKSSWLATDRVAVTDAEFSSPDLFHIEHQRNRTIVTEELSTKFVHDVLPSVEAAGVSSVTCWLSSDQHTASLVLENGHYIHKREYAPGLDLKTAAALGYLREKSSDSTYNVPDCGPAPYLLVFLSLVRAVLGLHEKGLLLRSLRAKDVLLLVGSEKVILPRIGRMRQLTSSDYCHDCAFPDMHRWLGPEVLLSEKYGPENDVFLLGTVFWETLWIMELSARDPAAQNIHFAPFADIPREQIVQVLRENTPLPYPGDCEDWLYQLILQCRDPNPSLRPTSKSLVGVLSQHFSGTNLKYLSWPIRELNQELTASDATELPPELPPRNPAQFSKEKNQNRETALSSQSNLPVPIIGRTSFFRKLRPKSSQTLVKLPTGSNPSVQTLVKSSIVSNPSMHYRTSSVYSPWQLTQHRRGSDSAAKMDQGRMLANHHGNMTSGSCHHDLGPGMDSKVCGEQNSPVAWDQPCPISIAEEPVGTGSERPKASIANQKAEPVAYSSVNFQKRNSFGEPVVRRKVYIDKTNGRPTTAVYLPEVVADHTGTSEDDTISLDSLPKDPVRHSEVGNKTDHFSHSTGTKRMSESDTSAVIAPGRPNESSNLGRKETTMTATGVQTQRENSNTVSNFNHLQPDNEEIYNDALSTRCLVSSDVNALCDSVTNLLGYMSMNRQTPDSRSVSSATSELSLEQIMFMNQATGHELSDDVILCGQNLHHDMTASVKIPLCEEVRDEKNQVHTTATGEKNPPSREKVAVKTVNSDDKKPRQFTIPGYESSYLTPISESEDLMLLRNENRGVHARSHAETVQSRPNQNDSAQRRTECATEYAAEHVTRRDEQRLHADSQELQQHLNFNATGPTVSEDGTYQSLSFNGRYSSEMSESSYTSLLALTENKTEKSEQSTQNIPRTRKSRIPRLVSETRKTPGKYFIADV